MMNYYTVYGVMGFDGCAWEVQRTRPMSYDEDFFKLVLNNSKWMEYSCDLHEGFSTEVQIRIIWDGMTLTVLDFRHGGAIGTEMLKQNKRLTRTQWKKLLAEA